MERSLQSCDCRRVQRSACAEGFFARARLRRSWSSALPISSDHAAAQLSLGPMQQVAIPGRSRRPSSSRHSFADRSSPDEGPNHPSGTRRRRTRHGGELGRPRRPAADRRGVTRPQGTACDVGAYKHTQ
ncbi:choice-of-anchor Q domain-containing protein [Streptomyces sp. NPDC004647]|uniref:choice-of-anchor Q domain-containing protein n=1 Tax=Streptomyces sp. NPDC004647 TaxID=3154671 RepID=UPI0033BE2CD9